MIKLFLLEKGWGEYYFNHARWRQAIEERFNFTAPTLENFTENLASSLMDRVGHFYDTESTVGSTETSRDSSVTSNRAVSERDLVDVLGEYKEHSDSVSPDSSIIRLRTSQSSTAPPLLSVALNMARDLTDPQEEKSEFAVRGGSHGGVVMGWAGWDLGLRDEEKRWVEEWLQGRQATEVQIQSIEEAFSDPAVARAENAFGLPSRRNHIQFFHSADYQPHQRANVFRVLRYVSTDLTGQIQVRYAVQLSESSAARLRERTRAADPPSSSSSPRVNKPKN